MTQTFYWHDYETWGAQPSVDRPAQFAGLRTDLDFNPVGEPLVVYARPADDFLPQPEACLVTGLAPQQAEQTGVIEAEFAAAIEDNHITRAQLGSAGAIMKKKTRRRGREPPRGKAPIARACTGGRSGRARRPPWPRARPSPATLFFEGAREAVSFFSDDARDRTTPKTRNGEGDETRKRWRG